MEELSVYYRYDVNVELGAEDEISEEEMKIYKMQKENLPLNLV